MSYKDVPVVVTGAGGFIGSHLVERLVHEHAKVRCLVRYNSRGEAGMLEEVPEDIRAEIEIVQGDLRDQDAVSDSLRGASIVFHLGAIIPIPYSYLRPREVVETNVLGTLNVVNAARSQGNVRVVHTSTSETYGTARYVPIDEAHPLQGQSPYAASKIAADKIVESFVLSYDLPAVTIRPFNTFGPRQSTRAIIPTLITQALTMDQILVGDLTPTRDLNFVQNLVEAFLAAGTVDKAIGEVINVGTGIEISIGDLAQKIQHLTGRDVPLVKDPSRIRPAKSEVRQLLAEIEKARLILDWRPSVSLEDGLEQTIRWISSNIDHYNPGTYHV
jgi:NAD dependent epimerase/dehydratase